MGVEKRDGKRKYGKKNKGEREVSVHLKSYYDCIGLVKVTFLCANIWSYRLAKITFLFYPSDRRFHRAKGARDPRTSRRSCQ